MESEKELWRLAYYHGLLPREDTVTLIKNNGDFLIRKSEENAGDARSYILSVVYNGLPKHYIFREEKGRYAVDFKVEKGFRTIKDFVDEHVHKGTPVCSGQRVILIRGIEKREWELAHSRIEQGPKLGSGAFGIVRRGILQLDGGKTAHVAIKEATLTKCTKEQIKEFMNEARIMRKFKHPNVILSYGVAVGEEPLMIVMELATHGALKDYLQQHNRSVRSKLFMCMGAASGINHVHEKNIIHCDIASRNCLYSEQKVKIADFGLARELQEDDGEIKLDKDQRLPIKWLAPETMRDRVCTKKTDVWAFGIMCWEIFANGATPYANIPSNNDVARRVIMGERMAFPEETPPDFAEFMSTCVWAGSSEARCSMQQALDWIDRSVRAHVDSGDRSMMGSAAAARPSKSEGRTMKEASVKDKSAKDKKKSRK